ncbi:putative zinc finger and BTB domain-containing protein 11 [Sesbania bispinosa]|nr:putative zinc finger and BTB domain-containing protein 11 [Sesbania bispinosa]
MQNQPPLSEIDSPNKFDVSTMLIADQNLGVDFPPKVAPIINPEIDEGQLLGPCCVEEDQSSGASSWASLEGLRNGLTTTGSVRLQGPSTNEGNLGEVAAEQVTLVGLSTPTKVTNGLVRISLDQQLAAPTPSIVAPELSPPTCDEMGNVLLHTVPIQASISASINSGLSSPDRAISHGGLDQLAIPSDHGDDAQLCDVSIIQQQGLDDVNVACPWVTARGKAQLKKRGRPRKKPNIPVSNPNPDTNLLNATVMISLDIGTIVEHVWHMGKQLGVCGSCSDQLMLGKLNEMECRDRGVIGRTVGGT